MIDVCEKGLRSLRFIDLSALIIETRSTAAFTFGLEKALCRSENGKKINTVSSYNRKLEN